MNANIPITKFILCNLSKTKKNLSFSVRCKKYYLVEQRVFPYSFHEFLAAHGVEVNATSLYGSGRAEIDRLLDEYFQWGGFPELVGYVGKRRWLNELYEKILLGDVIQRWGIRNEKALRLAMKRLAENIKNPTSYNRLANMVKIGRAHV